MERSDLRNSGAADLESAIVDLGALHPLGHIGDASSGAAAGDRAARDVRQIIR